MILIKSLMLVLLVSFGGAASAQQSPFTGVRQVDVVVEELSDDAIKCGITKDGIDAAVRLPISTSRIKIDSEASPYVYVNMNIRMLSNGLCVANIYFAFNKYIPSERGTGSFWYKGTMLSGGPEYVARNSYITVENFTKQLIAAWLKSNP